MSKSDSADVKVSSDASEKTTFTFPSPVFLKENTEYSFVAKSNDDTYNMYTARMGQKTLDDSRLISKQPFFGFLFLSDPQTHSVNYGQVFERSATLHRGKEPTLPPKLDLRTQANV